MEIGHDDLVKMTAESTGNSETVVDSCVTGYGDNMAKAVRDVIDNHPDTEQISMFTPVGGYVINKKDGANGTQWDITGLVGTDFFDSVNCDHELIKQIKEDQDKANTKAS